MNARGKGKGEAAVTMSDPDNKKELDYYNALEDSCLEFLSSLVEGRFELEHYDKLKSPVFTDILITNMNDHY